MTLDLLAWKADATTSGPRSPSSDGPRTRATPAARWASFVEAHPFIAAWILEEAQHRYDAGALRISAKALAEEARAKFHVPLNNTGVAAMALWLVERDARLGDVIERRVRKAAP